MTYREYFFSQPRYMKASPFFTIFIIFFFLCCSSAEQGDPALSILKAHEFSNKTEQLSSRNHLWANLQQTQMMFSTPMLMAEVLCFIASSISSAGGIGGGGLFIPILTIVAGLDLKAASSFSAFMVTGGSLANIICNLFIKNSKYGGKCLIDYDIALLSEPCMLLGVGIGVICNLSFPEWLITVLFASFLAWSTFKTCTNGVLYWKLETEKMNVFEKLENGSGSCDGRSIKEPLIGNQASNELCFPWKKVGVLVLIWFSFFAIYLVRGNRSGESVIPIETCGSGYWILSSLQIPLAVAFTSWILFRKEHSQYQTTTNTTEDITSNNVMIVQPINKIIFPTMALLAGGLGGVFGIGGGMLISPLLLHVGISPEVTAATCSFMVFFSSTMSSLQYLLLGMEHTDTALLLSLVCFFASLLGLVIVQRAIKEYGRASLIVFSVSIVMVLSTVLMTGFGAVHVWQDHVSGKYMGFKSPC